MTRSILITGCSSGIGHDAAKGLHTRGWRVFATCRAAEDCERLAAEGLESFPLDLDSPASIQGALDQVLARTGGTLDALYNNGAFACPGAVEDIPRDALRAIFETNLFGTHDLTRRVIPVMRRQGHGRILNCSSVLGFVGAKWRGAYASTKFAMEGLTDILRLEMEGTGVHVVLIQPGPITSDLRRKAIPHFERWIDWKTAARADEYRGLLHRLYEEKTPDRWELPARAVTDVIARALEAERPRARYRITAPTKAMAVAKRLLPTSTLDRLLSRA
ncbi:SDR family NAD(P)-dependent oxidoreductase [Falsirhodobacter sp. 1013]|uniref:SDR family NAD(P)-dependent oxidoreductase n=1 Tax=Falsirhodobacter sp. 1013 TaxID=3417566 RepID=UPI003EBD5F1A